MIESERPRCNRDGFRGEGETEAGRFEVLSASTGSNARACASVMPTRTPAAAARWQWRATTCRSATVLTSSTAPALGRFACGVFFETRRRVIRSIDQFGRYRDSKVATVPLQNPTARGVRKSPLRLAAAQLDRPTRIPQCARKLQALLPSTPKHARRDGHSPPSIAACSLRPLRRFVASSPRRFPSHHPPRRRGRQLRQLVRRPRQ